MTWYIVPDLHGRLDLLLKAVEWFEAGPQPYNVVTLGDYVDRGPESRELVSFLRSRPRWVKLRGNHEEMLCKAVALDDIVRTMGPSGDLHEDFITARTAALDFWLSNGGMETLDSYGIERPEQPEDDLDLSPLCNDAEWLASLPLTFSPFPGLLCVHAGVRPGVQIPLQEEHDLLWIRREFLESEEDYGMFIVHGHSCIDSDPLRDTSVPRSEAPPILTTNRLNLDGRAYARDVLWVARFSDEPAPEGGVSVQVCGKHLTVKDVRP